MQTLHVQARSDGDRLVHLEIPVESANATYDVVVVLRLQRVDGTSPEEGRGWPPGFFEATAGAWEGDFVRDQGEFEEREPL